MRLPLCNSNEQPSVFEDNTLTGVNIIEGLCHSAQGTTAMEQKTRSQSSNAL